MSCATSIAAALTATKAPTKSATSPVHGMVASGTTRRSSAYPQPGPLSDRDTDRNGQRQHEHRSCGRLCGERRANTPARRPQRPQHRQFGSSCPHARDEQIRHQRKRGHGSEDRQCEGHGVRGLEVECAHQCHHLERARCPDLPDSVEFAGFGRRRRAVRLRSVRTRRGLRSRDPTTTPRFHCATSPGDRRGAKHGLRRPRRRSVRRTRRDPPA